MEESEMQARLALALQSEASGQREGGPGTYPILAITAGEGNGWLFSEDVLRESLALWDGVEVFVDHAQAGGQNRSIRDLAGVLSAPAWDAQRRGVACALRPFGPAAALLEGLAAEIGAANGLSIQAPAAEIGAANGLSIQAPAAEIGAAQTPSPTPAPRVGFSADVIFTAQGRSVQKILRVLSVDLVYNPARGGAFLSAPRAAEPPSGEHRQANHNYPNPLHSTGEPLSMDNTTPESTTHPTPPVGETTPPADSARIETRLCEALLESSLSAARLPQAAARSIRARFAGQVFQPDALAQAIDDARAVLSELTAPSLVQGPGRVSEMVTGEEQFSAALYDLLGAPRPAELTRLRAAKLSGIRELYVRMTGDADFHGGCDPERAQFSTSADLPAVLKNAMNRLIAQEWQELGRSGYRWWEPVVAHEHFTNLHQITGVLVGEVNVLPTVNEGAAYSALPVSDSEETGAWTKYGGYIGLTLEMFERDETHRLRQYPRKLASAGLRRISALVGSIFTAASGVGPTMADGSAVFHAAHSNLGSDALTKDSWEAASAAIYNQPMLVGSGTAPLLALDARYLIVPRALRLTGRQILYPSWERESGIVSENLQRGELGDVITCPEFTDANNWAAAADPRLAPGIILAERFGLLPEIIIADGAQNGALFTNDEIRMKARHWLAVFVADYRPLYKANVA